MWRRAGTRRRCGSRRHYEATTLGGLVSEIAGHIPLPGEVIQDEALRFEVLASTDRRVERVRVRLIASVPNPDEDVA